MREQWICFLAGLAIAASGATAQEADGKQQRCPPARSASVPQIGGFVAVIATRERRMDALKAFADAQQKYSSILAHKLPAILETDAPSNNGVCYSVLVGPPGSRNDADDICNKLARAGYKDCAVIAY
jgi:hypothetical protein